ncbi:MAG: histone deacetylase [Deferrisomatales bacterium]|nr:histone deacetylase [Deferrisomatales bacterium]
MAVGWIEHPFFRRHWTGRGHPDQPERLDAIARALEGPGIAGRLVRLRFGPATAEDLALVHEPAYVELVRRASEAGFGFIGDPETRLCPESYDVAALATGGVLAACKAVRRKEVRRAFCAVRPPGHHAESDRARGYCLFNHVAVAAEHLLRRGALERVAIVDLDAHHGNGTQALFEARGDVLYVSLHEHPLTLRFPGTGYPGEVGRGDGRGATLNVPLPPRCDGAGYLAALRGTVLPALERFRPAFLLLSTGFDAQATEPGAHLSLAPEDFRRITRELAAAADALCGGRLVSVLEGGYELRGLGPCAAAHVAGLLSGGGGRDRPRARRPRRT